MTSVFILQTWDWCHSKDLELRIPKHIQLVKIAHIRPEKIEFKVGRSKFEMYVLLILCVFVQISMWVSSVHRTLFQRFFLQ